ncbi:OmpA family protein [Nostoc sp. CMAA1605]|uniref:OmpA family protein n=1 Tax=Nostoc sp. CMAA1605 TaxID=2055159 RepID=UPI002E3304BD|nr:OmpA family protein [Nostoc sp. CMAA1605]
MLASELQEIDLYQHQIETTSLLFFEDTTDLTVGEADKLKDVISAIQKLTKATQRLNKNIQIQIRGHTDTSGSEQHNISLSQARAQKILNYLQQYGISLSKLQIVAVGASIPLQPEINTEAKKLNRRVSFTISISNGNN